MSGPWWGRERSPNDQARLDSTPQGPRPRLVADRDSDIVQSVLARGDGYTGTDWAAPDYPIDPSSADAGGALVSLFGEIMSPVLQRANRLADNALRTFLSAAGVCPLPARPAAAVVKFTVSPGAGRSVFIERGFQVGARAGGELITYETQADLHATPDEIAEIHAQRGSVLLDVTADNEDVDLAYEPFGADPQIGHALLIGLASEDQREPPSPSLSIGIQLTPVDNVPAPVASGGVLPARGVVSALLRWEVFDGSKFEPVDVLLDETNGLRQSGRVELKTPARWSLARPAELDEGENRRWLRVRFVHGEFERPPRVSFVRVNVVGVRAIRTINDEVLVPVSRTEPHRRQVRYRPVVPDSLTIEVDDSALGGPGEGGRPRTTTWNEVDELATAKPGANVFTLDPATGIVTFGEALPAGFRNVRATKYETGGGRDGRVGPDETTMLIDSAPFVTGVTNLLAATGGTDAQADDHTVLRGPTTIQARQRAVTVADYALMASMADGADVRRAHAISGFHPRHPRSMTPGVVGVLIVTDESTSGPPVPTDQSLAAVAQYLSERRAPAVAEVVVASPAYRRVRTVIGFVPRADEDVGETIRQIKQELDKYLHPLTGGDDGRGWPFGGTLSYASLLRLLMTTVPGVRAVPLLRLIVDGVAQERCADVPIRPYDLFWPEGHEVLPREDDS